jgi:hypothetical protein
MLTKLWGVAAEVGGFWRKVSTTEASDLIADRIASMGLVDAQESQRRTFG